jgi:hypothetical protein
MKERILKIMSVFAAAILILGSAGCGAKPPTATDDLSDGEQQKLTASTEIVTVADDSQIAAD